MWLVLITNRKSYMESTIALYLTSSDLQRPVKVTHSLKLISVKGAELAHTHTFLLNTNRSYIESPNVSLNLTLSDLQKSIQNVQGCTFLCLISYRTRVWAYMTVKD